MTEPKDTKRNGRNEGASRRNTLKKLGMGTAIVTMSTGWQTPVVNSVIVPAHAQTTEEEAY